MTDEIKITYSQEPHPCKTQECELCKKGGAHSPHWYASISSDGSERHLYLGGEFRPVLLEDFLKTESRNTRPQNTEGSTPQTEEVKIKKGEDRSVETLEKTNGHKRIAPISKKTSRKHKEPATLSVNASQKAVPRSHEKTTECRNIGGRVAVPSAIRPRPNVLESSLPTLPTSKEFYRDLNKFKNVRFKDVKVKYRQLIKKYHPDQYAGQDLHVQEWMKIINMVHDTHLNRMHRFIR